MDVLSTESSRGPYSSVVRAGDLVFLSGQGGLDSTSGQPVPGGIVPETRQSLRNIEWMLAPHGLDLSDLVSVTCYLVDMSEWEQMNHAYAAAFPDGARAVRTAVGVSALPFGLRLELSAIAHSPADS